MKCLILTEENKIVSIIDNIVEINKEEKSIIHSNGKWGGVDFNLINFVVTDSIEEFKIGDTLPDGIVDLKDSITVETKENQEQKIRMLENDIANILMYIASN